MSIKHLIYYTIIFALLVAIYGAFDLSLKDFQGKISCPKLLGLPICYLVSLTFFLTFLSHMLESYLPGEWLFFIFLAVPFTLAFGGTLTEMSGTIICPRSSGGIPLCYLSLALCSILFILKVLHYKFD